jgi:periplasmic protein TonB
MKEVVMKFIALTGLLLAGTLASSSLAGEPDKGIEVTGPTSVATWSQAVSRNLDYNLDNEIQRSMMKGSIPTGSASVRFRCSENGEPTAIEVMDKSGDWRMKSIAKGAVADIKTLHPLPAGLSADQVFVANIVVATGEEDQARYMADLRDKAQSRTSMAGSSLQPIAFNVSIRAPG